MVRKKDEDQKQFTPSGRPIPFVGAKRAAGLVPERKVIPPTPETQSGVLQRVSGHAPRQVGVGPEVGRAFAATTSIAGNPPQGNFSDAPRFDRSTPGYRDNPIPAPTSAPPKGLSQVAPAVAEPAWSAPPESNAGVVTEAAHQGDRTFSAPGGTLTTHGEAPATDRVAVGPDGLPIRPTIQQKLGKVAPGQNIRANSDGYSFEGSAGDAQRFFAPTGRGNPEAERNWALAEQQRRARQPQQRVFRGGQKQPDPNLDPRSGWGWKGRQRVAEMGQDAAQSADRNRIEQQKMAMSGQESAADRALRQRQIMLEDSRGMDRNAIDAANTESQMAERQFTLGQQQQVAALQKRHMESTDPAEKKQIEESLKVLGAIKGSGVKTFSNTTETIDGGKVEKNYFYDPDGSNVREAIPQGQQQQGLPMPTDKKQLIKGEVYATPKGPATWDGKAYIPVRAM